MRKRKLLIDIDKDRIGLFAVINGKIYAKNAPCNFKDNNYLEPEGHGTNKKCRKVILQVLLNGLELTLKTGLRIGPIDYFEIKK